MSYTMVIADDEPIVLKSQELFIQKEFPEIYVVGMAKNGIELKEMLEAYRPDLAIVDIRMPGLSGIEVMELLKENGLGTHFIINTAYSDFEYVKKALDLKSDGYILKPGKRQEKIDTIERLLRTVREERKEDAKRAYLDTALGVVNPMFGGEILLSIFSEKCDEKNFESYLKVNGIRFVGGCILTFLSRKDLCRKDLNQELGDLLEGVCDFLATVTKEGAVVMLFMPEGLMFEQYQKWRDKIAGEIAGYIRGLTGGECLYGTGGVYSSFSEMPQSYRESIEKLTSGRGRKSDVIESEEGDEKNKDYVQAAERYIRANFSADISLADCADYVGISSYYLSHIFKEKTGRTFVEYLTDIRINYAKELCQDQSLSAKDISERCGYLNITYFYKVFKKLVGITIGEYRRQEHVGNE